MILNESMEDATIRLLQESMLSDMYDELPTDYDNKEVVDDSFVEGIIDDIIVVTDPDLDSDAYDELIARAQEIVANTPEGELPYTEDYLGKQLITCTACGNTFFSDEILQPGATCPVCKEIPEGFVVQGEVGKAEEVAQAISDEETEKEEKLAQKQAEQAAEIEQEETDELDLSTTETNLEELEASEEVKSSENKLEENKEVKTEDRELKLEDLSEIIGGDYNDFISELQEFRSQMVDAVEGQSTKLASQIIMDTIEALDNIIRRYEIEKDIEIEGALNESVVAETTQEVKEESVTTNQVINWHNMFEDAEDIDELQDIIYSVDDGVLENELQHALDQSIADEDELEVMKDFLIAVLEDNAEIDD